MRNRRLLAALIGSAMLAAACFKEPVTAPDHSEVNPRLLGQWVCSSPDASPGNRAELTILRFDSTQYYAEWKEDEKIERYRAYHGVLKGQDLLNATDISDQGGYWSAVRVSFATDGSLSLWLPAKRITNLPDDDDSLSTFRREAKQPDAWQPFTRCDRPKRQAPS
jgi:hypothetical protein